MSDYKSTLNLPETGFPMRGDLAKREPGMLARWTDDDLYGIIRAAKKGKKTFILHDGDPEAVFISLQAHALAAHGNDPKAPLCKPVGHIP